MCWLLYLYTYWLFHSVLVCEEGQRIILKVFSLLLHSRWKQDTKKWKGHLGILTMDKQSEKGKRLFIGCLPYWLALSPDLNSLELHFYKGSVREVKSKGILLMQSNFTLILKAIIILDTVYNYMCDVAVFCNLISPE